MGNSEMLDSLFQKAVSAIDYYQGERQHDERGRRYSEFAAYFRELEGSR